MNTARSLFVGLGVTLAAGVGAMILAPELAGVVPVRAAVAALGNDYFFVAAFGLVSLVLLVAALAGRSLSGLNQTTPPSPETVQPSPHFGSDFDETLSSDVGLLASLTGRRRDDVWERLRDDAIRAEIAASDCSRSTASARVENGEWTRDPEAAAFLSADTSPSVRSRVRAALRGQTWFERGARRTADAVASKWESRR